MLVLDVDRLPVVFDRVGARLVDIDDAGVAAGTITDEPLRITRKIDGQRDAVRDIGVAAGDQSFAPLQLREPASVSTAFPIRKRICDRREPLRTTIGNVCGQISA